jgi:hypothetical protein
MKDDRDRRDDDREAGANGDDRKGMMEIDSYGSWFSEAQNIC